jgi:hypothetical protein
MGNLCMVRSPLSTQEEAYSLHTINQMEDVDAPSYAADISGVVHPDSLHRHWHRGQVASKRSPSARGTWRTLVVSFQPDPLH